MVSVNQKLKAVQKVFIRRLSSTFVGRIEIQCTKTRFSNDKTCNRAAFYCDISIGCFNKIFKYRASKVKHRLNIFLKINNSEPFILVTFMKSYLQQNLIQFTLP